MRRLAAAVLFVLPLAACTTHEVYLNPQFREATASHQQVAVLPFQVTIARQRLPKNLTEENITRMEREEGTEVQMQLYTQLLRRADRYTVTFQDVARTNVLLERAGLTYETLPSHTKEEITQVLGVDALITGYIQRSKPMSMGASLALGMLLGPAFMGNTNEVAVNLQVHNGGDGTLLWTFADTFGGNIVSNPDKLAGALMTSIARQFPYRAAEQ